MEEGWALSRGERRDRNGDAVLAVTDSAAADAERRKDNSGSSNASSGMDPPPFGCFFSADESQRESGRKALRLQQQQQQLGQNGAGLARGGVGGDGEGAGAAGDAVSGGGSGRGGGDTGGGGGGGSGARGAERSLRVNPWRQMKLHELMAKLEDNSVSDAFFLAVSQLKTFGYWFSKAGRQACPPPCQKPRVVWQAANQPLNPSRAAIGRP